MSFLKGEKKLLKYSYDFAVDGGAVSTIELFQDAGNALIAGVKVVGMYVVVETAVASAGSPTLTIGNTTAAAGYAADCYAFLDLGFQNGEVAASLIYDDTNDHPIMYSPLLAADLDLSTP